MLLTAAGVVMFARTPAAMENPSSFEQGNRQEQSLDSVIERAVAYVESFERDFAAVVAEEQLEQRASNETVRRTRSDLLLVRGVCCSAQPIAYLRYIVDAMSEKRTSYNVTATAEALIQVGEAKGAGRLPLSPQARDTVRTALLEIERQNVKVLIANEIAETLQESPALRRRTRPGLGDD
jgi:hypothetical protein